MTQASGLLKLAELAKESSSERRRELLRDVTDLYFATQETSSAIENQYFDEILSKVTSAMDTEVRKEMAVRLADKPVGPLQLLRQLANDEIDVASPVLQNSPILQDKHLSEVIARDSQQHMQSISKRKAVSQDITRMLVDKGNDQTLITLAGNQGAEFDRQSMQTLVDKSEDVTALQAPLVKHKDLPADLMNDMYMFAEQNVRKQIVLRNEKIDPADLEKALAEARKNPNYQSPQLPEGFGPAQKDLSARLKTGALDGPLLLKYERDGDRLRFALGYSLLAQIDYPVIARILKRQDVDALALVSRAIGFDTSLFATIALLVFDEEKVNTGNSSELRQMYAGIPENAARRTLRFWQMRQKLEADKAA
ncbi:hypothetical protein MNBD_ALPHA06-760 [hydrothermal vent metagenome]|uniref:DUF2336 domain-containing protein n=1 Tax=hydrothermal vent metagenome TaxID=652676 RepID=A0A3B0S7H0_9ZZZZ